MKPLMDYPDKCGSCRNFEFLVIDNVITYRGRCSVRKTKYHQASQKACKKYVEIAND